MCPSIDAVDIWHPPAWSQVPGGNATSQLFDTQVWLSELPRHWTGLQCGSVLGWVKGDKLQDVDTSVWNGFRAVQRCNATVNSTRYVSIVRNAPRALAFYEIKVIRAVAEATCIPCRAQAGVVNATGNVPFSDGKWTDLFSGTRSSMSVTVSMVLAKCGGCRQVVSLKPFPHQASSIFCS